MKRVMKALHVAREQETVAGFVQIVFVLVVVAGTLGITALLKQTADQGPEVSDAPEQLVVDVLSPPSVTHRATRNLTGQVEARAVVAISPEVTGRVTSLNEKLIPGGEIAAGETLFTLDRTDYEIALERSRADVASAEAELEQAQADAGNFIKDWQRVYPDTPPPALVAKEPQIRAIKARLSAAKANVRQAETNLARTKVTAKNDVRITDSRIEYDQLLVAGNQYGSFFVRDALRIRVSAEHDIIEGLAVTPGTQVQVATDTATPDAFDAVVTGVGAALDDRTRLRPLIINIPGNIDLVPGVFVTVTVSGVENTNIFQLPAAAMASRNSVWRVASGRLEEVTVSIVDVTDDFVMTRAFDIKDGIVVSQVPTSFIERPVRIRNRLSETPSVAVRLGGNSMAGGY